MKERIQASLRESIATKEKLIQQGLEQIAQAARSIVDSLKGGGKVILFGNGGSAADSQHIASELVGRFKKDRSPLPAIALTTNTSSLTAISNDYGYQASFARQLQAFGEKNDVAIAISTSGNSPNVIEAVKFAKKQGLKTIALTGGGGGALAGAADISIIVPSKNTPRIQESHIAIGHIICELIEEELFKGE